MKLIKLFLLGFLIAAYAQAADEPFGKKDLKKTKELFAGTLYLRIDLPCRYGRHAFASYVDALVEVSPTGSNVGGALRLTRAIGPMRASIGGSVLTIR